MPEIKANRRNIMAVCLGVALAQIAPSPISAQQTFVTGKVYRADKKPAVGVWVQLESRGRILRFQTGGDGRYFIGYVQPGNYKISVRRNQVEVHLNLISLPANERYDIQLK